jgi:hypothetical protein
MPKTPHHVAQDRPGGVRTPDGLSAPPPPRLSGNAAQKAPDGVLRQVPGAAGGGSRRQLARPTTGTGSCSRRRLPSPSYDRALWALRTWLDSWPGIGYVVVGIAHQGFDLQLTRYDERGWRATFYTTEMEHSATSATGSAWAPTPWHAVEEPHDPNIELPPKKDEEKRAAGCGYFARKCLKDLTKRPMASRAKPKTSS